MAFTEEQERILKISLERSKGIDEKLQRPALEAQKEGMLLSRLLSQWILFGSFAGAIFLLSRLEQFTKPEIILFFWASLGLFFTSCLFAWLSIQNWATHYFKKSYYYSKFFMHETKAISIWNQNLKGAKLQSVDQFEGTELAEDFKKFQQRAIHLQNYGALLFILALTVGLIGVTKLTSNKTVILEPYSTINDKTSPTDETTKEKNLSLDELNNIKNSPQAPDHG